MKCKAAIKLFDASLEGTLEDAPRREVETHLESCGACQKEFQAARRLMLLTEPFPDSAVPNLRGEIHAAIRQETSRGLPPEKHMKKLKIGLGFGFATAICAVALGVAMTLTPKTAFATMKRATKAVQAVHSAKVKIWYRMDGVIRVRTVWSDKTRTRDENTNGELQVYKDGKTSSDPSKEMYIAEMDPRTWTIEGFIGEWEGRLTPVDCGVQSLNGQQVRLIRITVEEGNDETDFRCDYLVDEESGLPVKLTGLHKNEGNWVKTYESTYEFNVPLPDSLFELPAGKTWHEVPQGSVQKIVGGAFAPLDNDGP